MYTTDSGALEERMPFEDFIPDECSILVVGTFPTEKRNRKFDFYYANPTNQFWSILSKINDVDLRNFSGQEAVVERKTLLNNAEIGLMDMGKRVMRRDASSSDERLFPLEYANLLETLEQRRSIKRLIFTSSTGCNSALSWFKSYLKINNQELEKEKSSLRMTLPLLGRRIDVITVYSPAKSPYRKFADLLMMYKEAFNLPSKLEEDKKFK